MHSVFLLALKVQLCIRQAQDSHMVRHGGQHTRGSIAQVLECASELTGSGAAGDPQEFQRFEPQMNPWVAVAALAAALPPVLFWGRVFLNARRRVKEDERREQDRQVRVGSLSAKRLSSAFNHPATDAALMSS